MVLRRTVNGELEIGIWDKDKNVAPVIANAIVNRIQWVFDKMMLDMNVNTLAALKEAFNKKHDNSVDSLQLLKQISELEINLNSHPPVFIVVQKAYPAVKAGKPRVLMIVMATFFISMFLGFLGVILAEKMNR